MPTKKWIDKKTATNYQLRYRAQTDPLIHDDQASDLVFAQVTTLNASRSTPSTNSSSKIKTTTDLAQELSLPPTSLRKNEGEAAMHGVYYDDTEYDYMQHMRDINDEQVYFVDPQEKSSQGQKKKKNKLKLEDALRLPQEVLPSEVEVKRTYQDMQDVPDALSGFQPDMDPRLREVLEALEDEAYVEDDEDVFGELAKGGEISLREFEEEEGEEDGWESDATEKPSNHSPPTRQEEKGGEGEEDWHRAFETFKNDQKKKGRKVTFDNDSLVDTMSFGSTTSLGGTMSVSSRSRRRKKKAGTESSGYSMSSSALFRTEGLTLLDDRFDKIEEEYAEEEEEEADLRSNSSVGLPETRRDLDSVLDEFLEGYSVGKKGRVRRGKYGSGMEQLDEIRRGLGGARIAS